MDVGAFVQENRRWLAGCGIGLVVFLIASSVIGALYDAGAVQRAVRGLLTNQPTEMYTAAQVDELLAEAEALGAERARLSAMLAFERAPAYVLQPGASPDLVLFEVGRQLKRALLDGADERGVQLADKDLSWPFPDLVDEVQQVLFGLELMDEIGKRLFAAHDAVRAADEEATGLRAILQLRTEVQKAPQRRGVPGSRGRDAVDLGDLFVQQRVAFKFEADGPTLLRFCEACRQPGRTLVLEGVKLEQPDSIREPVLVSGSLLGIAFKKEQP